MNDIWLSVLCSCLASNSYCLKQPERREKKPTVVALHLEIGQLSNTLEFALQKL